MSNEYTNVILETGCILILLVGVLVWFVKVSKSLQVGTSTDVGKICNYYLICVC